MKALHLSDIIKFLLMLLLHLKFLSIVLNSYKYWQNNTIVLNHFLTKFQAFSCGWVPMKGLSGGYFLEES